MKLKMQMAHCEVSLEQTNGNPQEAFSLDLFTTFHLLTRTNTELMLGPFTQTDGDITKPNPSNCLSLLLETCCAHFVINTNGFCCS